MLDVVLCAAEEEMEDSLCSILLLEGNHLRHGSAPSLPEPYVRTIDGAEIGPAVGSCGTAAFQRRTVIVEDVLEDPLWADYRDLAREHGLRACWSVPITKSDGTDDVLGTFAVYYRTPRAPSAVERSHIESIGELARTAIERSRLDKALHAALESERSAHAEARRLRRQSQEAERSEARRARHAMFAAGVGTAFAEGGDLPRLLSRACELAVEHFDAYFARIWTLDEDEDVLVLRASAGRYTHVDGDHARVPVGELKIGRIARRREPHLSNNVLEDPAISDPEWARREGVVAFAGYPLLIEERVIGVFAMFSKAPFSEDLLEAVAAASKTMALGIERHRADARRETVVEELARTLQLNEMFAGMLGHDLRNPLSSIVSSAHLLLARETDEHVVRPASRILTSSERMRRLIDQILDFTRIRSGGGIFVEPRDVDLDELCSHLVAEHEVAHPQREITLQTRGVLLGEWDPDRLGQVFCNLLGNALEHGDPDQPVEVLLDGSAADEVRLEVANGGVIPESSLDDIFDPFRRSMQEGARGDGLGLGLYISERIVAAHGGGIGVASDADRGTRFTVSIPRRAAGVDDGSAEKPLSA